MNLTSTGRKMKIDYSKYLHVITIHRPRRRGLVSAAARLDARHCDKKDATSVVVACSNRPKKL